MRKMPYLIALALGAATAHAQKIPVKVTDMLKIKTVGEVHLSPDGSKVVFTLTNIEPDSPAGKNGKWDYKYLTQLYVMPTDVSRFHQLTTAKEGASQPAWNPQGTTIAFVREVDGKPQIFLLSMEGGEPTQFTHFRYGASSPRWSPDGKFLLFSARIDLKELIRDSLLNPKHALPAWTYEKPGIAGNASLKPSTARPDPDGNLDEVRAWLDNNVTDKKAKVVNKLNFQDETGVNPEMVFTHWFTQRIWPTAAPEPVTFGFYNFSDAEYSADGTQLIFTGHVDSTQDPERDLESEIYIASDNGSDLQLLLGEKNKVFENALPSPDNLTLAYTESPTSFVSVPQLKLIDLRYKTSVSIPFDRTPTHLTWSTDSRYLYFIAQSNGGAPLYRLDRSTRKIDQLTDIDGGATSFDENKGHLIVARTSPRDPSELYKVVPNERVPVGITTFNTGWLGDRRLSMPEHHSFKNSLGETIDYWVMKPVDYHEGQRYPLLLEIHGGPSAMWGPGEPSMWHEFQFFCGKGYGVVYCNPRGSGGYGLECLRANIKDWGDGPTTDVLTALDSAVAEGWADTGRLVVSGGSYAGYLTAWIVGHDHRFKAACAQRGVYDLSTFFGEGNAWRLVPQYFGGYPWEPQTKALLDRESPITYVANITTPLIIFHGGSDRRTGFVQSEMLFRSLKVLKRPVEYVRHPGATHEITRSGDNRQRIDQLLRTWEFFDRYVH